MNEKLAEDIRIIVRRIKSMDRFLYDRCMDERIGREELIDQLELVEKKVRKLKEWMEMVEEMQGE